MRSRVGTKATVAVALAMALAAVTTEAEANPVVLPIPGYFEVRQLAPQVAAGASDEIRAEFVSCLRQAGYRVIKEQEEVRSAIEGNFSVFQPLLVEYASDHSDGALLSGFYSWYGGLASDEQRQPVRDILRSRFSTVCDSVLSQRSRRLFEYNMYTSDLLRVADAVSDYDDHASLPLFNEMLGFLEEPGFEAMTTPEFKTWWHLHHAAARILDPEASRILLVGENGGVRLLRTCDDVERATLRGHELDSQEICLVLEHVGRSESCEPPDILGSLWSLEIFFSDGVRSTIVSAGGEPTFRYHDNLRFARRAAGLRSPGLHELVLSIGAR